MACTASAATTPRATSGTQDAGTSPGPVAKAPSRVGTRVPVLPAGTRRRGQRLDGPPRAWPGRWPRPDGPLPGRDIGHLHGDRDRPAAGHQVADRLYPVETVARPRLSADTGPAAGEPDRHRSALDAVVRVEP